MVIFASLFFKSFGWTSAQTLLSSVISSGLGLKVKSLGLPSNDGDSGMLLVHWTVNAELLKAEVGLKALLWEEKFDIDFCLKKSGVEYCFPGAKGSTSMEAIYTIGFLIARSVNGLIMILLEDSFIIWFPQGEGPNTMDVMESFWLSWAPFC